ncbi:MAG: ABC transporter ATP-binding protein [Microbacteriaceae bacterium]|nr:ABC transporter ATP-binding protein [Microbacteriaceae bacterium]
MNALQLSSLTVDLNRTRIIQDATFKAPGSKFVALVGPNGAGKSTLLHAIAGVSEGEVHGELHYRDLDLAKTTRRQRAKTVALVEQDAHTDLALTVDETVSLGRLPHLGFMGSETEHDRALVIDAIETVGLNHLAFRSRVVTTLSGGERQKVLLAKALAQQPQLLLLDEPTNHLDIAAQLNVLSLLRKLGSEELDVFAAIHDLNLALSYSDEVVVLSEGRVVASGPVHDTLTSELVSEVFKVNANLVTNQDSGEQVFAFKPRSSNGFAGS